MMLKICTKPFLKLLRFLTKENVYNRVEFTTHSGVLFTRDGYISFIENNHDLAFNNGNDH